MSARPTLYQFSLLQSLAQGNFDGFTPLSEVKRRGNTGIGTFDGLNGELIAIGGTFYRSRGDGSIELPGENETVPFCCVTDFKEDVNFDVSGAEDFAALQSLLNERVSKSGKNLFHMAVVSGFFPYIRARSIDKQRKPYARLDEALAAGQIEKDYRDISGTLVGLYCPSFARGINSPGWHFHFISEDKKYGGHVLKVSTARASAALSAMPDYSLILPEQGAFQEMDLALDMGEAIKRAETASSEK